MSDSGSKQSKGGESKFGGSSEPLGNEEILDLAAQQMAGGAEPMDLETMRVRLHDAETRALRYQADLDNFRRRTRRELDDQLKYASLSLINGILDSLDNLERALGSIPQDQADSGLAMGVRMVAGQIFETLRTAGCQKIDSVGQSFDPNLHQAVQTQPSETVPANQILHELRTGYQLYERIIRPAQVIVSAGPGKNS